MSQKKTSVLVEEQLAHAKLKKTPARLQILELFYRQSSPISVAEVFSTLQSTGLNAVTCYRTMTTFVEQGILRQVDLRHGHVDYELARADDDHHHLVCVRCGKMEDFEGCGLESTIKGVLRKSRSFKTVEEHALELFGTCRACA